MHPNVDGQEFMFESAVQGLAETLGWIDSVAEFPTRNVSATWGRSSEQSTLAAYCGNDHLVDEYTFINIAGIRRFGLTNPYSILDVDPIFCNQTFEEKPDLLSCPDIANDIKSCQNRNVKVLITLGGDDCDPNSYDIKDPAQAEALGEELWNTYFGGESATRPFGDVVLDGINFDVQQGTGETYVPFIWSVLEDKAMEAKMSLIFTITTKDCTVPVDLLKAIRDNDHGPFTFVVRYTQDPDEDSCHLKSKSFAQNVDAWMDYVTDDMCSMQILVPQDLNNTAMSDIDFAMKYLTTHPKSDAFDGVSFESIERTANPPMTAKVINTFFKPKGKN